MGHRRSGGRGQTAPKIVAAVCTAGAIVLGVPGTAGAAHDVVRGRFVAEAPPLPDPSIYFVWDRACLNYEAIHRKSQRFVAPWDGLLVGEIITAVGGWSLTFRAVDGPESSYTMASTQTVTAEVPLRAGEEVDIVACNASGAPRAEVRYEFRHANHRPLDPPARPVSHRTEGAYGPLLGTVTPIRYELLCGLGCIEAATRPAHRYITSLEVDDAVFSDVSLIVYQGAPSTGAYREDYFCTGIDEPIELIPNVGWVGVSPVEGPCLDGTMAGASTGTIAFTLSSTPEVSP